MNFPQFGSYAAMVRWVLAVAWGTNRALVVGLIATGLLRGIVPALMALAARGLIDAAVPLLGSTQPSLRPVLPWALAGMAVTILEACLQMQRAYLNSRLTDDLNLEITGRVLSHASELDIAFFEDSRSQDMLQRAQTRAAERFTTFLNSTFTIATTFIQAMSLTALLVALEPWTLGIILALAPPYVLFQSRLATMSYEIEYARATKRRWTTYFVQQLTMQPTVSEVKLLGLGRLLLDKFRKLMDSFREEDRQLYKRNLVGSSLFATVATVLFYGLLVRVVLRAIGGQASLGDVAIFAGAAARLRSAVQEGIGGIRRVKEASLHITALRQFFDEPPRLNQGHLKPASLQGQVRFENVRFTYPGSLEPALRDVTLEVAAGETLAIVGENGSGKTTLMKLLARLYDPSGGRILLDEHDLRDFDLEYLHARIGFVFQNFTRYEAAAGDNIAYGDWRSLLTDRERVEQIARLAGVDDLIQALPKGYDTRIGPRFGERDLSAGQWQQIAVARAFARPASILILDEPSASLDVRAEYELFKRFQSLAHGRTTILISHRFSTVSIADRIAVMEGGKLVELGTHDDLMHRDGHYAELYGLHRRELR